MLRLTFLVALLATTTAYAHGYPIACGSTNDLSLEMLLFWPDDSGSTAEISGKALTAWLQTEATPVHIPCWRRADDTAGRAQYQCSISLPSYKTITAVYAWWPDVRRYEARVALRDEHDGVANFSLSCGNGGE